MRYSIPPRKTIERQHIRSQMLEREHDKTPRLRNRRRPDKSYGDRNRHKSRTGWFGTLLAVAIATLLRLLNRTWRITFIDRKCLDTALRRTGRQPVIALFWHGTYVPLFAALQDTSACVFTSDSFRGNVICEICRSFHYNCIPLPGDHAAAVSIMQQALATHGAVAIAADGPHGPYHSVKRSVIELAIHNGADILPISVASRPHYIARSRWDRFTIPYPFSQVSFAFGQPIKVGTLTSIENRQDMDGRANINLVRQALEQNDLRALKTV